MYARARAESIGEEIKKEIVSSRCFKLPFITTHKPDLGSLLPPPPPRPPPLGSRGHLVPPSDEGGGGEGDWVAGRIAEAAGRKAVYIIVFCSPRSPIDSPSLPRLPRVSPRYQKLLLRPLFLMGPARALSLSRLFPSRSFVLVIFVFLSFFRRDEEEEEEGGGK